MPNSEKSHDTGLRIIEVLKILLMEDINKPAIIEKLKHHNEVSNALTLEAYLKYFNTFDVLGLNIEKENGVYCLKNALINIDLTQQEEKILVKLMEAIPKLNNKHEEEILKKLIFRLDKYVNTDLKKEFHKIENTPHSDNMCFNIVNTLKQALEDDVQVKITYKKRNGITEELCASIKRIIEEKGQFYVMCFNSSMLRSRRICINSIDSVQRIPRQAAKNEYNGTVVYEVYGRLAKSYKIKAWETLNDFGTGFMRINNTKEDYETLIHRLFKYGENCKIIQPANVIEDFLSLTDDVLHNLEEEKCQE